MSDGTFRLAVVVLLVLILGRLYVVDSRIHHLVAFAIPIKSEPV